MKTITIQITVPDGVDVQVGGGNERPFVERPAPPEPNDPCPVHGTEWRLIQGGYSKTKKNPDGSAKRFNPFWVCTTDGCNEKPPREEETYAEPMPF